MATYTTRNNFTKPAYSDAADIGVVNTNMDTIDASFAKCNWAGTVAPVVTDDSGDGYAIGSLWFDTTGHSLYVAEAVTVGAAVWRQVYPQGSSAHTSTSNPTVNDDAADGYVVGSMWVNTTAKSVYIAADVTVGAAVWRLVYPEDHGSLGGLTDDDHTQYLLADGTRGLSGDWNAGKKITVTNLQSTVTTGTAPLIVASTTAVSNLNADQVDGIHSSTMVQSATHVKGDIAVGNDSTGTGWTTISVGTNNYVLTADSTATGGVKWAAASGGASFWTAVPGSPTRTGNNTFTLTDTAGANNYQYALGRGTLLKWTESTAAKIAMVTETSLSTDTVTVYIIGDAMASIDSSSLKYCLMKAEYIEWILAGTLAAATDYARTQYMPVNAFPLQVEAFVKTAGTTNASTFDVNDDGTSIMASDSAISIASAATSNLDSTGKYGVKANAPQTVVVANSIMSVDVNTVSTTAPIEGYIKLWYMPRSYYYRS